MPFKVGDRVVLQSAVGEASIRRHIGVEQTVTWVDPRDGFIETDLMPNLVANLGPIGWNPDRFTLAPEPSFKAGDIVEAVSTSPAFNLAPAAYVEGGHYEVRCMSGETVMTVSDELGSVTNGWHKRFFRLVSPAAAVESAPLVNEYFEPCSEYRACVDENGNAVVEAVRVKTIARCTDTAEAERIAAALNAYRNN